MKAIRTEPPKFYLLSFIAYFFLFWLGVCPIEEEGLIKIEGKIKG